MAIGIGGADITTLTTLLGSPGLVVPVTDLNSLGNTYPEVTNLMRQALGMATDLVDPPTPPGSCANRLDLALIIDASSSLMQQNKNRDFQYVRHFLEAFVANLGVSYTGVRVGIVVFSNYASVRMTLDQTWDLPQVVKAIKGISYIGGDTNIAYALRAARTVIFASENGDRFDVSNVAVLVTDGRDNVNENEVAREAGLLKATGATVLAVGVTNSAYMQELSTVIASKPEYAVYVAQYEALQLAMRQITDISCSTSGYFPRSDIAIVIDASSNIGINLSNALQAIYSLLNGFDLADGSDIRIGIVVYGQTVQIVQTLDSNIASVLEKVLRGVISLGGVPDVVGALNMLMSDFFTEANGDRLEAPNIALFFTSAGVSVSSFQASANMARTMGISVVAMGVSSSANMAFLDNLAFRYELAFALNSYTSLPTQLEVLKRAARIAVGLVHVPHWRPNIPRNQLCFDTCRHGIQCFCWDTQKSMNSTSCININECAANNGYCSHMCTDTDGEYFCSCPEGLVLSGDSYTCLDVNECENDPCPSGSECINTYGGYVCLMDGPSKQTALLGSLISTGQGTLAGATIGTAVGTILLMLAIALVVRTQQRKKLNKNDASSGHDNAGYRNRGSTLKASSRAFENDGLSMHSSSTDGDIDSLASFSAAASK